VIPYIREIFVSNYKSMQRVATTLEPFTLLVGPNGAGKSNFIDCLAFVQECLSESVETAVRNRGGFAAVVWGGGLVEASAASRPSTPSYWASFHAKTLTVEVRLVLELGQGATAEYGIGLLRALDGATVVSRERCSLRRPGNQDVGFEVDAGEFVKEIPGIRPRLSRDHLALFAASATEEFRPLYDFLTSMRFYSILPSSLRELQESDSGRFLRPDGSNAAAVLRRLAEDPKKRDTYERVCRLLGIVVEGIKKVEYRPVGSKETLLFTQEKGEGGTMEFEPRSMSDGTLRVLGLLLAIYQAGNPTVVGIEEPETTVHPAAADAIVEALLDAARERQVLVTTHSPDILDYKDLNDAQIRAVAVRDGSTLVCPVSAATREAIRSHLYTPGELLSCDELNPDLDAAARAASDAGLRGPTLLDRDDPR
jgi:predicted ATPase